MPWALQAILTVIRVCIVGKLKQTLEVTTNIAVIIAVVFVAAVFYHSYFNEGVHPIKGDQLPHLGSYVWSSSEHTLVLALRKNCRFCEESMPFYRRLAELKKKGRLNANLIAIFPNSAQAAQGVLRSQNVEITAAFGINLGDLKIAGTPTLILADSNGRIEKYWVGKQTESGEDTILRAMGRE